MFASLRKFANTKIAAIFVFIIIIPFVFWGMGGMFSSGNTNNLAKINNQKISTKDFMDYLNQSGIEQKTLKDNLDNNIIEELLEGLISSKLLELEIEEFDIFISELTLLKKIKTDKFFLDESNSFQRTKYEKFLLSNNMSAPLYEQRIKNRELQKNLFNYVGAGTITPNFLIKKDFLNENRTLNIKYFELSNFYKKKEDIKEVEITDFIEINKEQLKRSHIDFKYAVLNPINLVGVDDFNQEFFDKIDIIENDISQGKNIEAITEELNIDLISIKNYIPTNSKKINEDKIYSLKSNNYDIIEIEDNFLLFKISSEYNQPPNLNDTEVKDEIIQLVLKKNEFDFNRKILEDIQNKKFDNTKFNQMGINKIENISINSIDDDDMFDINSVKILYTLEKNEFTLVTDKDKKIFLVKIEDTLEKKFNTKDENYLEFSKKINSNNRSTILRSYDQLLSKKYKIELNQKTIDRVKNYFK